MTLTMPSGGNIFTSPYCWTRAVQAMSDYFKALDPVARRRYAEKLQLLGMVEQDDPYAPWNEEKFVEDM